MRPAAGWARLCGHRVRVSGGDSGPVCHMRKLVSGNLYTRSLTPPHRATRYCHTVTEDHTKMHGHLDHTSMMTRPLGLTPRHSRLGPQASGQRVCAPQAETDLGPTRLSHIASPGPGAPNADCMCTQVHRGCSSRSPRVGPTRAGGLRGVSKRFPNLWPLEAHASPCGSREPGVDPQDGEGEWGPRGTPCGHCSQVAGLASS